MLRFAFLLFCAIPAGAAVAQPRPVGDPVSAWPNTPVTEATFLEGRELDARVAVVTDRLATAGTSLCPVGRPYVGLRLQHLSQFNVEDRAEQMARHGLDRGPGVMLVVRNSPAARGGVKPGDIVTAIDGVALPPEPARDVPFAAARAHERADAIVDLIDEAGTKAFTLTLLRAGRPITVGITPSPACPAQVHLARSGQRNAFADGRHVFLTTGLLSDLHNDEELAFVLAHELAHNILGHAEMMREKAKQRGSGGAIGRDSYNVRAMERDADRLGGRLMIAAGYDPTVGVAALFRIDRRPGGLFGVHDAPRARLAAMQELVRSAPTSR